MSIILINDRVNPYQVFFFLKKKNVFVHTLLTETTYVKFNSSKLKFSFDVYRLSLKLYYVSLLGMYLHIQINNYLILL